MSVFRRRIVFRDDRETKLFGSASIVTAVTVAAVIVFAGTADGSTTGSTGSASGTIVFGGGTVSTISVEVSSSGSIVLGGSAAGIQASLNSASGAVAFAGTARCDALGSGAIVFGGSATVGTIFTMDGSGAIVFAGTATPVVGTTVSGTVVFAGGIGVPEISGGTVTTAASGTIVFNGTAAGVIGSALNVPLQFYFETAYNVDLTSLITSLPEVVQGNAQPATVIVTNGTYSINGGAFSSDPTTVAAGDSIQLRHVSAATYETQVVTTLTLSGISGDFVSVTKADTRDHRPPWKRRFLPKFKRRSW